MDAMKHLLNIMTGAVILLTTLCACSDDDLPTDAVLESPISGLVVSVNGEKCTALPQLDENGSFADKMLLTVKIPSRKATIVQLNLADKRWTSDVQSGDEVMFEDNLLPITLYENGTEKGKYWVEMKFNPPPFYYFIRSGDTDEWGGRYFLHTENPQTIASATYDNKFEGYVDLTDSNWDNVGLINSDQTKYYDFNGGPWPAVSNYSWTGVEKDAPGWGYFPCDGPWNDWLATDGNTDIVSPGVWRVAFDSETFNVDMTMTQWTVSGSAVGNKLAMTYSHDTKTWTLTAQLTAGTMRFETIPVMASDPTFNLGLSDGISQLADGGADISVSQAGNYSIELDLSKAPYYTYSLEKN